MKIALLQKIPFEFIGVMFLSSVIKRLGHECEVFIADLDRSHLLDNVRRYSPDLIAFSLLSNDYGWFKDTLTALQQTSDIPVIVGGPHATFFPELIESNKVKAVFLGEAEGSLEAFLSNYAHEDALKSIDGIWYKDSHGIVHKNNMRLLCENLDELPFPDRGLYYDKYTVLRMKEAKTFMTTRGCPYRCAFCYSNICQKLYQGKGKYFRQYSPERIIQEIKETKARYLLKSVSFEDFGEFPNDPELLITFLSLYKQEVDLPFKCSLRANMMTDDLAKALKDAGANTVIFGIESGSEHIRNTVLNKHIMDEHIISCARMLKKYRIKFGTYNMFGIPSETIDDAFKTVELNIRIKTDYPWGSILIPYPKTDIAKIAVQLKLLPEFFDFADLPPSYFSRSPLQLPEKHLYENLQKMFYVTVKYPLLFPLVKKIIRIKWPPFFKVIFVISFIIRFSKEQRMPLWKTMRMAWGFRNSF
jgi:radical SAM superfamily enzyme YgiQ (UPF0313 family)